MCIGTPKGVYTCLDPQKWVVLCLRPSQHANKNFEPQPNVSCKKCLTLHVPFVISTRSLHRHAAEAYGSQLHPIKMWHTYKGPALEIEKTLYNIIYSLPFHFLGCQQIPSLVPIKFGQAALESSVHLQAPQDRTPCWWLPLVQGVVAPTHLLQRANGSNGPCNLQQCLWCYTRC